MTVTPKQPLPAVVSAEHWREARAQLLEKEKAATRALDALAAERRRLPMVRFDKPYLFEGPGGRASLVDLFEGRRQLLVYHFMLEAGQAEPCQGCSLFVDNLGHLSHLHARDTSLVLVSRATVPELERVRARMGWTLPWYSLAAATPEADFNADCGIKGGFGLSVFLRDGDEVFRSYFTTYRGVERVGPVWTLLDLTPLGRQENWEDSPEGWPQNPPYLWWRHHDRY